MNRPTSSTQSTEVPEEAKGRRYRAVVKYALDASADQKCKALKLGIEECAMELVGEDKLDAEELECVFEDALSAAQLEMEMRANA
jgi:hypothetical protein